jgi:hypothetical protein
MGLPPGEIAVWYQQSLPQVALLSMFSPQIFPLSHIRGNHPVFAQIDRLCPRLNYQLFSIWAPSLRDSRKSSVGLARFRRLLGDDLLPLSQ